MFDQTFVDGVGKTNKSWTVGLSFFLEFALVGVMILIPLIWTEALPKASLVNFLTAPAPPPPPPPPPPPQPVQKIVKVVPRQFNGQTLQAPRKIPTQVAMISEEQLAPLGAGTGVVGGIEGGVLSGLGGASFASIGQAPPPPPPPPKVVEAKPATPQRIRVGGNVQAANLIKKVTPNYPPLAKQARIQGTVHFTAIIGKDGTIQNLQLVSGHPLLVPAATDAVKQWVYKPTLLNGDPVEVITQIDVNFTLSQ